MDTLFDNSIAFYQTSIQRNVSFWISDTKTVRLILVSLTVFLYQAAGMDVTANVSRETSEAFYSIKLHMVVVRVNTVLF